MSVSLPFISVVVPAYNRPDSLQALLLALADQSYPPYRFDVLVCDDGSDPPLVECLATKMLPYGISFLRAPNMGPAGARNRGLNQARGSIVAFTDDDCLPQPHWLEAIAQAMERPETYAVHGPTRSSVPPIEPFIHSVDIEQAHGVATANFAVRRERLLAVQGFDETFRVPFFEDEDLSRRLQADFGPIAWSEDMRVDHPPRPTPYRKAWRTAKFYYYLPYMQGKYKGYWQGAMPAHYQRVCVKTALVLLGLAPLVGAPKSFAVAWLALGAWQGKRLQAILGRAMKHGVRVPVASQLAFFASEWLLDYVRVWFYLQGLGLEKVQPEVAADVPL